ncbi:MAG: hypothetical protein ACYDH1_02130 [Anaerolineaceae bacterium]
MRLLKKSYIQISGILCLLLLVFLLSGCAGKSGAAQPPMESPTTIVEVYSPLVVTETLTTGLCTDNEPCPVSTTESAQATQTFIPEDPQKTLEIPTKTIETKPIPTLSPEDWKDFPVIPINVSEHAREIYRLGIQQGNDPKHFSKIGDCQNINTYFLAIYDDPSAYSLGEEYKTLQETIDYYNGMWSRDSISVKNGFNVANIFNPWFNNKELCDSNETPIDCELRINKPSVVLISMEAWWNGDPARYATYYRRIVETVLSYNAVPILATKADNLEGNNEINRSIVQIAYEYDVPVWNFWRAVQNIPKKGLEEDGFHITHGLNDFSDPNNLQRAWPVRNLTALQAIDAVRLALQQP